jgi:hypothetical protein
MQLSLRILITSPSRNSRALRQVGSEEGWAALAGGPRPLSIADDHDKFVVFKNPDWDFKTLSFQITSSLPTASMGTWGEEVARSVLRGRPLPAEPATQVGSRTKSA